MLPVAISVPDVLQRSPFKRTRGGMIRLLIFLLCMISCRQGRYTLTYTVRKVGAHKITIERSSPEFKFEVHSLDIDKVEASCRESFVQVDSRGTLRRLPHVCMARS